MPVISSHAGARTVRLASMSVTVKAADAAQFLSLVPQLLGCTPTQSLVLVPMAAGRSLGALRLDLPPDDLADAVASSAIGMLCRIGEADAMIAVVYTDEAIAGAATPPGEAAALPGGAAALPGDAATEAAVLPGDALISLLGAKADACGLRLVDALTVAADGWGSHLEPDLPPGGHPLDALQVRGADASALAAGGVDASRGDQASGATLPQVGQTARRAVAQSLRSLSSALEVICGIPSVAGADSRIDPAALEAACELDDLPALFEEALRWQPSETPMHTAMLGWCLSRPSLRDVALVQWATDSAGGDIAMEAQRRWEDGADYPADLASLMWGEGPRPDAERLESALRLVREVAALLPKKQRPGPLAMCAWLSWALGRSSHADRYAGMALAIDRRHGLADIVRSFAQAGHLPDWAFRLE